MSDEQTPSTSGATTQPVTAPSTPPSFADKFNMDAKTLWNEHRLFFIIFGVLILFYQFRNILIDILLNSAKSVEANAKKEDSQLASQETDAKTQANQAVQDAQNEPKKETPVAEDWYKKK